MIDPEWFEKVAARAIRTSPEWRSLDKRSIEAQSWFEDEVRSLAYSLAEIARERVEHGLEPTE